MTERIYGSKYRETANESTTQIAARVRADIKAATRGGRLPASTKVSVRSDYYSGGSAIRVAITAWPGPIANPERARVAAIRGVPYDDYGIPWALYRDHSPELRAALALLDGIMGAYNYDGSDIQSDYFDVRFSGHATVQLGREQEEAAQAAAVVEAKAMLEAERVVRERVVLLDCPVVAEAARTAAEEPEANADWTDEDAVEEFLFLHPAD